MDSGGEVPLLRIWSRWLWRHPFSACFHGRVKSRSLSLVLWAPAGVQHGCAPASDLVSFLVFVAKQAGRTTPRPGLALGRRVFLTCQAALGRLAVRAYGTRPTSVLPTAASCSGCLRTRSASLSSLLHGTEASQDNASFKRLSTRAVVTSTLPA